MTRPYADPRGAHRLDEDRFLVASARGYKPLRPSDRRLENEEPLRDGAGDEVLRGRSPSSPQDEVAGMSTFASPDRQQLEGVVWRIGAGTALPDDVGIHKDGHHYGGKIESPPDHATIYPTRDMPVAEWDQRMSDFVATHADRVGKLDRAKDGGYRFRPTPEYARELENRDAERDTTDAARRSDTAAPDDTRRESPQPARERSDEPDHEEAADARVRRAMAERPDQDEDTLRSDRTRGIEDRGR
jgi:hypothetical protein